MSNLYSVVILAGGLATRLRPLTEKIPKSLVEINGSPFIAYQLALLKKQNIKKVVLCLGFLGEQIVEYVKDGSQFGLDVSYSFEHDQLLGTAGAIKNALPQLDDNFFVLYGDSYLLCDFQNVQAEYERSQKMALMTVYKNKGQWDSSNVEFKNKQILAYDKLHRTQEMQHIDYGLGIFNKQVFAKLKEAEFYDLALLYQEILKNNELAAFEVQQRFYEVGSVSGINELSAYLTTNQMIESVI